MKGNIKKKIVIFLSAYAVIFIAYALITTYYAMTAAQAYRGASRQTLEASFKEHPVKRSDIDKIGVPRVFFSREFWDRILAGDYSSAFNLNFNDNTLSFVDETGVLHMAILDEQEALRLQLLNLRIAAEKDPSIGFKETPEIEELRESIFRERFTMSFQAFGFFSIVVLAIFVLALYIRHIISSERETEKSAESR